MKNIKKKLEKEGKAFFFGGSSSLYLVGKVQHNVRQLYKFGFFFFSFPFLFPCKLIKRENNQRGRYIAMGLKVKNVIKKLLVNSIVHFFSLFFFAFYKSTSHTPSNTSSKRYFPLFTSPTHGS